MGDYSSSICVDLGVSNQVWPLIVLHCLVNSFWYFFPLSLLLFFFPLKFSCGHQVGMSVWRILIVFSFLFQSVLKTLQLLWNLLCLFFFITHRNICCIFLQNQVCVTFSFCLIFYCSCLTNIFASYSSTIFFSSLSVKQLPSLLVNFLQNVLFFFSSFCFQSVNVQSGSKSLNF